MNKAFFTVMMVIALGTMNILSGPEWVLVLGLAYIIGILAEISDKTQRRT